MDRTIKRSSSILAAVASAVIFGFTPIMAKYAYSGGSNGIMMSFTRALFALPVLFLICKHKNLRFRLKRPEFIAMFFTGIFGSAATTLLLYSSYSYIPVGNATTIHFCYPIIVTFILTFRYHDKLKKYKIIALSLCAVGIFAFINSKDSMHFIGIILAFLSSISYAILMISIERSPVSGLHSYVSVFYFALCNCIVSAIFGLLTKSLNFNLTAEAWAYSLIISILVSVIAFSLFKFAISTCGAFTTSLLSTIEPIMSVLLGWLILDESLTLRKIIGVLAILAGIIIVTTFEFRDSKKLQQS